MYPFGFEAAPKLRLLEVDRCKELKSIHVPPSLKELKLKWLFLLTAVSELNISISKAEDCGEHVQGYSPRLLDFGDILLSFVMGAVDKRTTTFVDAPTSRYYSLQKSGRPLQLCRNTTRHH